MVFDNMLLGIALRPIDGINMLILAMLIWIFVRIIRSDNNSIIWADYISSLGSDGRQRGDLNKVGQLVGILVAAMSVMMYADNTTVEPAGLSALLTVALIYLGGVSMFASWMRSKQGVSTTTIVKEPVAEPVPQKVTETKTQT